MAKHRTGHLFKRGKNFYVRWAVNGKVFSKALRDDSGNPITNHRDAEEAKTKVMAAFVVADEAAALESIAAKLEGRRAELVRLQDEQNPPLLIAKAWLEYLTAPNRPDSGESTLRQYEFQFGQFARWMQEEHAEAQALRDVTKEIAGEYAASLNSGRLSPSTYNKHLNLLALVFRVLKAKARLTSNPWEEIPRKRIAPHGRRELTVDELRKVCQAATGELRVLLALGVYSGLRLGDCATLRWAEVDMPRGVIRRIPNKTARRNPKPVIVPVHLVLRDLLADTPAPKRGEYVLPETAALYNRRTDLVTDMVQRHFHTCGIKPYKPGTGTEGKRAVVEVGFHSLRHTFVSLCRESNAPLAVVESIVGHSNPAMTRHYTHVGELAAGRAVAALPAVIGDHKPRHTSEETALAEIQRIAKSMTAANWKTKRAELLALTAAEYQQAQ
jgi:integrase